nr:4'-phosphopantetheinyl transferase superfamily protein [Mucilaginibacter sp. L294]
MGSITNRYFNDVLWRDTAANGFVISNNDVHVWRINIRQNLKQLEQFETLLTPEETLRAGKYKQQKDTYRFIVSRGAQRFILGRYLNTPPAQLQFTLGDNKKPYLVSNNGAILHYNLSHSGDWIVLAIAQLPVGADVEFVDPVFPFQDILEENFSKEEVDYIGTSPERFFTLWTRKEAILKATGQGLGDHLKITPSLNGEHVLDSSLIGTDKNWLLHSFNIAPGYISTVVCEGAGQQLKFFDVDLA